MRRVRNVPEDQMVRQLSRNLKLKTLFGTLPRKGQHAYWAFWISSLRREKTSHADALPPFVYAWGLGATATTTRRPLRKRP